jgi:hypothetical protein
MAAVSLAAGVPSDPATATYRPGSLGLALRYAMTCGRPGPGPLVVRLPSSFAISRLQVRVDGAPRPATRVGGSLTVALPKPPEVTCMSIAEGTLRVAIAYVRAPAGTYAISASLPQHRFVARLRVPA